MVCCCQFQQIIPVRHFHLNLFYCNTKMKSFLQTSVWYSANLSTVHNNNPMINSKKTFVQLALTIITVIFNINAFQSPTLFIPTVRRTNHSTLQSTAQNEIYSNQPPFSLPTSLFLAGLSFTTYVEPPPNSSRWERGSSGLNVAFLSSTYTRSLYSGILEVKPLKATDLPDEDDAAESVMTGGGVDASLLVGVVEGIWEEDIRMLEKEQFHNG